MKTPLKQNSEISVLPSEQNETHGVKRILQKIMFFAVVLTLNLSSVFCFVTFSDLEINYFLTALAITVATAVFFMLFSTKIKCYKITAIGVAVILIFGGIFFGSVINGAKVVYDDVGNAIATAMKWSSPMQIGAHGSTLGGVLGDADLFMILASVLISLAVTAFAVRAVSFVAVFLLSFPLFEIGAAFGCVPSHTAFAGLISSWIAMLVLSVSVHSKTVIKSKSGGKKSKKRLRNKEKIPEKCAVGAFAAAVAVFILFESLSAAFTAMGYGRDNTVDELRHQIKSTASDVFDYVTGEDHDGSLKEGKLYKMGDLKIKKRHYITMETDCDTSMYLRGFVGGEYDGSQWLAAEYDDNDAVKKLNNAKYYTSSLTGIMLYYSENSQAYPSSDITLSEFRRKKDYAYQTYGAYISGDLDYKNEAQLKPKSSSEYKFTTYDEISGRYDVSKSAVFDDKTVEAAIKSYNVFVRAKYTKVPSGVSSTVKTVGQQAKKLQSIEQKIDLVREYLAENCEYSLYSRKLPNDKEFTQFFLNEQKSGYSAHFATAATLMLREAGVSARYTEGYLIPQGVNEDGKVDVTDEYAHAWVEVYFDNYGWVPVEVTPTFYSGKFMSNVSKPEIEQTDDESSKPSKENGNNSNEKQNEPEKIQEIPQIDDTLPDSPEGVIQGDEKPEKVSVWLIFIIICAVILAAVIVFFVRYLILHQKLIKGLKIGGAQQRMAFLLKYYERLLRFEKIKVQNEPSYSKTAEKIAESSKYIDLESAMALNDLFIKSGFSNELVSEDDVESAKEKVLDFAEKIYEQGYEDSTLKCFVKHFKMKFVYVLKK